MRNKEIIGELTKLVEKGALLFKVNRITSILMGTIYRTDYSKFEVALAVDDFPIFSTYKLIITDKETSVSYTIKNRYLLKNLEKAITFKVANNFVGSLSKLRGLPPKTLTT